MYFKRIAELRNDNDVKQVEIAGYIGIKQATYSDYETNRINIPVESLIKIADFYKVSLDYLVGRSDKKGL